MRIVLERHLPRLSPHSRNTEQAGRASIAVNTALASAACGDFSRVLPAARDVLRLGPAGIRNYLRDSRLLDRVVPRLRAKLAGAL